MSKTKPGIAGIHDPQHLFKAAALARHRRLILPRLLKEEAEKPINRGPELDAAHKILLRWADLETDGHLIGKETTLDDSFRQEVFGEALRYRTVSASPNAFHYQKGIYISGIGTPDGLLGNFPPVDPKTIRAVIELKGALVDLDHDKSAGRTAVQQCWDYLNHLPDCPWGIVSNFVSFRLYHRDKTPQVFEHFELQALRDPEEFARFYTLFDRGGLLATPLIKTSRAAALIGRTDNRQREVGDDLYEYYSEQRRRLIEHLISQHGKSKDQALRAGQKLIDRIIFVAFCEDRGLLPAKLIESTWKSVAPLARVTNPRWQNFLDMFHSIDQGHPNLDLPTGYNGKLFAKDDNVDDLDLKDDWTTIFKEIANYDFAEDVSVEVLGHLFEKSVVEIEKLRLTGIYATPSGPEAPTMPKSAERKRFGIYYTPPAFTSFIVRQTVGALIDERFAALAASHGVESDLPLDSPPAAAQARYREDCLAALRQVAIVDPACGSGAFLIAAYELLEDRYQMVVKHLAHHTGKPPQTWAAAIPEMILSENLYGVDVSPEAVEITQLALWIRSARKGQKLVTLSENIVCGNSLVTDPNVHPRAMKWEDQFPKIFTRPGGVGFDCVVGNPPWERLKLQEREFFAFPAPEIASAVNAADRRKLIEKLKTGNPELSASYELAKDAAERTLDHVRNAGEFPLTGRGDINTYMVFAELAKKLVRPTGRVGLLVPSGIATDDTTKDFFQWLMESQALISLHDYENKEPIFPDVHRSFKFSAIIFGGAEVKTEAADFVFFARNMRDLSDKNRHIELSEKDLELLNPNTRTCPIFRTRRDAEITKAVYRRVPILIDEKRKAGGNPWGIRFFTMFHQTNDAEHFAAPADLKKAGAKLEGNRWKKGKTVYLPLYEAKMVQAYDHRAASVIIEAGNWVRQGQTEATTLVEHQNPEFVAMPRWWVEDAVVTRVLREEKRPTFLSYKDVTSATNQRTMIAAFIPRSGVVNSAPLMLTGEKIKPRRECCLLANLNSIALDFCARQKVGGLHLNFFIIEQFPILPPDAYDDRCPWDKKQTLEKWISDRVLKLTCTADDMRPLAEAAGFAEGVHKWKEPERADLRTELDAAYFHLYGLSRDDAAYILTTFAAMREEEGEQLTPTSPASAVLDAYDKLGEAK
ncbi:MAG TPA: DNA methyltransferase [Tepidisphaeraceae bacterium]